MNPNCISNNCY